MAVSRRTLRAIVILFLLTAAVAGASAAATLAHAARDEHRWCAVLGDLSATQRGKAHADFARLSAQFGCR